MKLDWAGSCTSVTAARWEAEAGGSQGCKSQKIIKLSPKKKGGVENVAKCEDYGFRCLPLSKLQWAPLKILPQKEQQTWDPMTWICK